MSSESSVGLPPDQFGKKARTLQITVQNADGTLATVEMLVVAIADKEGDAADVNNDVTNELLRAMLSELRALRQMYGQAANQFVPGFTASNKPAF